MLVDFQALLPTDCARFLGVSVWQWEEGDPEIREEDSPAPGLQDWRRKRSDIDLTRFRNFCPKSVQIGLDFTRNKECTGSPQPLMLETREKRQIASLVRGDLGTTSTLHFEHELVRSLI